MTTIIVKNSVSFAAGPLVRWKPPVDGALVAAFVGDADDAAYLKNFGSTVDLTAPGSAPTWEEAGFRRFTNSKYLLTAASRQAGGMSLVAVLKKPSTDTSWALPIANERSHVDGGRRGFGLAQTTAGTGAKQAVIAYTNGGTNGSLTATLTNTTSPTMIIGTTSLSGATTTVNFYNMTTGNSASSNLANATAQAAADEAAYPYQIMRNYLGTTTDGLVGFVGIWPVALDGPQRTAIYNAVKKRFTALGVTI